jgi:hypothetical protein
MRFFTMDWWQGVQAGGSTNPSDEYQRHLASLRPFPDPVTKLDGMPSLHDARLRRLENRSGSVEIQLDLLDDRGNRTGGRLVYGDAELFLESDPDVSLPGPGGLGDLGYDEISAPEPGVFEHRLLFSSGVELCLRFRKFDVHVGAVQTEAAADGASRRR